MNIQVLMPHNADRDLFLQKPAICRLEQLGRVEWNETGRQYTGARLAQALCRADVLVTGWNCPKITQELVHKAGRCPGLLVHLGGTLAPYVELSLYEKGLRTVCANEMFARSVAEGVMAYLLSALRNVPYWNREMHAGNWREGVGGTRSLMGKSVGLVGYGAIGRNLVPLLKAFGARVKICSEHLTPADCRAIGTEKAAIEEIFAGCDVISLHAALSPRTRQMVNGPLLASIRDGALFINTARAGLVETPALLAQLRQNRFTAVLDVFDTEPLAPDDPLRTLPNVLLIPHLAGPAADLYPKIGLEMVNEIGRWKEGKPLLYETGPGTVSRMTQTG